MSADVERLIQVALDRRPMTLKGEALFRTLLAFLLERDPLWLVREGGEVQERGEGA